MTALSLPPSLHFHPRVSKWNEQTYGRTEPITVEARCREKVERDFVKVALQGRISRNLGHSLWRHETPVGGFWVPLFLITIY